MRHHSLTHSTLIWLKIIILGVHVWVLASGVLEFAFLQ